MPGRAMAGRSLDATDTSNSFSATEAAVEAVAAEANGTNAGQEIGRPERCLAAGAIQESAVGLIGDPLRIVAYAGAVDARMEVGRQHAWRPTSRSPFEHVGECVDDGVLPIRAVHIEHRDDHAAGDSASVGEDTATHPILHRLSL